MKVIDLLNKIANGEEVPKKVKYEGDIFEYDGIDFQNYDDYEKASLIGDCIFYRKEDLNNEVEIIEDTPKEDNKIKYIEYLDFKEYSDEDKMWCLVNKLNHIIDKVNGEDNE